MAAGKVRPVPLVRVPLTPQRRPWVYGLPFGVKGLCRSWQDGHWAGPMRRPEPAYRCALVISTWFGTWRV